MLDRSKREGSLSRQINLRVDDDVSESLDALAYLRGISVSELIRRTVTAEVDRERNHPALRQAMEARATYQGEAEGNVRRLRTPEKAD